MSQHGVQCVVKKSEETGQVDKTEEEVSGLKKTIYSI